MYRAFSALRFGACLFSGLLIVAVTILGAADVVGRYVFDRPIEGQVELSRVAMAYIVFLGLAEGQRRRMHPRIELIDRHLSPRQRAWLERVLGALALATMAVVAYAATGAFLDSWTVNETMIAPIPVPAWLARLAVAIGCVLFVIELGFELAGRESTWRRR